jgi:ATP-dependent DNA helicase RecQ
MLDARAHDADAGDALARVLARFGHTTLRPGQADVIADVLSGRPVIAVMPTGAGKSLCYQLPAVVLGERGGVTLVVSPLIALMKDQVDALRGRGIPAVALTSAADAEEQRDILEGIRAGAYTLVYIAPERFRSPRFVDALHATAQSLALVAIDEAHCISEWGHDFRPDYRRLGPIVRALGAPRIAAFTATATPEVRRDIAVQLGLDDPHMHVRGFDRPNLTYEVAQAGGAADKADRLVELVRTRSDGVALVYAATRKNAEQHAATLKAAGMRARVYHAGLDDSARERAQDVFMAGQLDVIVATNAFGMGIDKPDIRIVVHADVPRSPEAYYQEAGRGGRDGKPTRCVLLFNHSDVRLQEFLIAASYPSTEVLRGLWKLVRDQPALGKAGGDDLENRLKRALAQAGIGEAEAKEGGGKPKSWASGSWGGGTSNASIGAALRILERHGMLGRDNDGNLVATRPDPTAGFPALDVAALERRADVERDKLKTMVEYAYWPRCRRQYVLAYFGDQDWADRDRRCGACDNCIAIAEGRGPGMSEQDGRAIRGLLNLVGSLHGRYGRMRVASIANATDDDDRFLDLPGRGCLRGWPPRNVMDLLRALEGASLIEASRGDYPTISTTKRGDLIGIGKLDPQDANIQMPAAPKPRSRKRR